MIVSVGSLLIEEIDNYDCCICFNCRDVASRLYEK